MTTSISRHVDAATLMSFAAGALSEPLAAAVSAHVSMCAQCRAELRDMTLIGAALFREAPGGGRHLGTPARPEDAPAGRESARAGRTGVLPLPLARRYGLALETIPWVQLGSGVWQHRLALSPGVAGELYLIRLAPGVRLPVHGHAGTELTLVIEGAFSDATGEYRRGDLQEVDAGIRHQPLGDAQEGCVCLIAAEQAAITRQ